MELERKAERSGLVKDKVEYLIVAPKCEGERLPFCDLVA